MSARLSLRDVGLRFGALPVLDGVTFDVAEGELVCLVGPSGCGKSTVLNVVGGFLGHDRGQVLVDGQPVRGPDRRRLFVFQEGAAFPWLTVAENVGFGLSRLARAEREAKVREWVQLVGLAGFEQAYPRQLSGGMRQRVELARALAADPDALYMDEPFGALDYLTRLRMRAELERLWQLRRRTVLFVTHDVDEAVQLADRVVVLGPRPARVVAELPIDLPRPRVLGTTAASALRDRLLELLGAPELTSRAGP